MWRRIKAALRMGLVWALGWGVIVGGGMEFLANFIPALNAVDMWIQPLAMLGFLSGALFSLILGVVARNRKFSELSVGKFAFWGLLGGAFLGAVFVVNGLAGQFIFIPLLPLSVASAAGSLAIARRATEPQPELAAGEAPEPPQRLR